jgi:hypothetical protein
LHFHFSFYADSPEELAAQLAAVSIAIPPTTFAHPLRGFEIIARPSPNEYPGAYGNSAGALASMGAQTTTPADIATNAAVTANKPPRAIRRGTPKTAETHTPTRDEPVQDEPVQDEPVQDEHVQDETPPASTPAQDRLRAMEILRDKFSQGAVDDVRALQAKFGVKKFVEVPDADGPALLAAALAIKTPAAD